MLGIRILQSFHAHLCGAVRTQLAHNLGGNKAKPLTLRIQSYMLVLCLMHAVNAEVSMDLATQSVEEAVASVDVCLSVPDILTFECDLIVEFFATNGGGTYV